MVEQTYALAKSGVFGMQNGVYQDSLTSIVDDFEDNDIAEYAGDTGQAATVTTPVVNGGYALELTTSGSSYGISSDQGSGLNYYPDVGDTVRLNARADTTNIYPSYRYFTQSSTTASRPAGYQLQFWMSNGEFRLLKVDSNGSGTELATQTGISYSASTWYEAEVSVASDNTHTARLLDDTGTEIAKVSATDSTYTDGGVGWEVGTGATSTIHAFFDHARKVA